MIRTKSFPQRQNQYCSRQNQYWSFTRKSFPLGQNQYWSRQNHEQIIFTTWLEWHRVNSQGALGAYPTWRREKEEFNNTFCQEQRRLAELINGPWSSAGYPTIWHQLETGGLRIPIVIVQDLSKEMDPEGSELRKKHRLKRRRYKSSGPNYAWHTDAYYKLKQLCFPVHGAIEGFNIRLGIPTILLIKEPSSMFKLCLNMACVLWN